MVQPDASVPCPLPYLSLNEVPHITISTIPQASPAESNAMLEHHWLPVDSSRQLTITARVGVRLALEQVRMNASKLVGCLALP